MSLAHADQTPTPAELIARAEQLVPSLRERGARIAETMKLPDDVVADLSAAGLRGILRPRRYGGPEHSLETAFRIGRALARGDGSTAWVYLVTQAPDLIVELYPEKVQAEYWSSENPSSVSSYMPSGKIDKVAGGFELTGKWGYASGIDHAGWAMIGGVAGMVEMGGSPMPDMRLFMIDLKGQKILDDWNVMGLRGTGSKTLVLEKFFVSDERVISFGAIASGIPNHPNPLCRQSLWTPIGFCIAGPATGIAQGMYDILREDMRGRFVKKDMMFMGRLPMVQAQMAEVAAMIDASDMTYMRSVEETFDVLNAGGVLTPELKVRNRRNQAYSALLARQAGEKMMALAGARCTVEGNPIQRGLRDLSTVTVHPGANWDSPALSYGSVELGAGPTEFMI